MKFSALILAAALATASAEEAHMHMLRGERFLSVSTKAEKAPSTKSSKGTKSAKNADAKAEKAVGAAVETKAAKTPGFSPMSNSTVIEHVVLMKVKASADDEDIKKLVEAVNSLRTIPGVMSITIGPTFAEEWMPDRRDGYTHALSVRLKSKEALKVYQDHPVHVQMKKEIVLPLLEGPLMAVDYESAVVLGEN